MSDTLDILTLAEAKKAVGIPANSTNKDTQVALYVTGVSRAMDSTFGPVVHRTITGELHDGGNRAIHLRYWPCGSISTVVEYDNGTAGTLTAETPSSLPEDAYLLDNNGHTLWRRSVGGDSRFPTGRRNVYVTYVAGRAATTSVVDEDFKLGASLFLKHVWRAEEQSTVEVDEFDVPRQTFPRFGVPNVVKDMLSDYVQTAPSF